MSQMNFLYSDTPKIVEKEGNELFISLVRAKPWLYNKSDSNYSDKVMRSNAWLEISEILGLSVEDCIKNWERLKGLYVKEKMDRIKETKSGSGKTTRKPWPLFEQMRSLHDCEEKSRSTVSNLDSQYNSKGCQETCYSGNTFKNKPKPRNSTMLLDKALNSLDSKFQTMLCTLEKEKEKSLDLVPNVNSQFNKENVYNNTDHLVGVLVAQELKEMSQDIALRKYKKIMRILSDIND